MSASPVSATCDRRYTAYHDSGSRSLSVVKWIVLHDEEGDTAEGAARYFTSPASGGSAHLCVDDNVCFRTLGNDRIPWGAASSFSANTRGFHIEQAGYARWSSVLWRKHLRTLQRAAYKTALHCHLFGIPVRFVTARDLPRLAGITTHAEVTKASKRLDPGNASHYDHTDPGAFWPRRLFMRYVRKYAATFDV